MTRVRAGATAILAMEFAEEMNAPGSARFSIGCHE